MTYFAKFDHAQPDPKLVVGWYDTGFTNYPTMPSDQDLMVLTDAQWASHMASSAAMALVGGVLSPYTPPPAPLTLAQQAMVALAAPYTITDTGTPADGGAYAIDATAQVHLNAEVTSLILNGTFADGTTTVAWPDTSGAVHTFTVAEFKVFATAVGAYVAALYKVVNGVLNTLPAAAVASK